MAVYPATYNNPYNQFPIYQQPTPVQPMNGGGLTWVSGEAGAKSYLVSPNSTVPLFDSEGQTIYLKSADASGMPSIKVLDYTIREVAAPVAPIAAPVSDYATRGDIDTLRQEIEALKAKIEGVKDEHSGTNQEVSADAERKPAGLAE